MSAVQELKLLVVLVVVSVHCLVVNGTPLTRTERSFGHRFTLAASKTKVQPLLDSLVEYRSRSASIKTVSSTTTDLLDIIIIVAETATKSRLDITRLDYFIIVS
jgi:hypothetical protein